MKKIPFAFPALAVLVLVAGGPLPARDDDHAYPITEKDEVRKTVRVAAGSVPEVSVDNVWGGITVEPHSGTNIEMVARRTILAESKDKLERARAEVKLETLNGDILIKKAI